MTFDLQKILENKRALRRDLAARPRGGKAADARCPARAGSRYSPPGATAKGRSMNEEGSDGKPQEMSEYRLSVELDDLKRSPFIQRGGLGKAHQLFGQKLPELLDELNEALAA